MTHPNRAFWDRMRALERLDRAKEYRRVAHHYGRMGCRGLQREYAHDALREFRNYRFYAARAQQ